MSVVVEVDSAFEGDSECVEGGLPAVIQRALPRPVGSRLRMVRYKHFMAACSLGKWPLARTERRKRAWTLSIAFVE